MQATNDLTKNISILLTFLIALPMSSQEKRIFDSEFNEFVLQCETIGRILTDKGQITDLSEWYEGRDNEITETNIRQLESDIDNSALEVTYYLIMLREDPLMYTMHFFNKETKEEFGQLFISFRDKQDDMVDDLKLISKEKLKTIDLDPEEDSRLFKIPSPPPPPPKKKQ